MAQQLLSKTGKTPPTGKISYEEFLAWADEDVRAEWVDGEVLLMSPASFNHQEVVSFLVSILRTYTEERDLGTVVTAPFQMKLRGDLPGREPDLMFIGNESRDRVRVAYLDGPAELVVEVISLESRARDRGDKFYEYEQGGVREYWLIDPIRRSAEFYQLDANAGYQLSPAEEGLYRCRAIQGLTFRPEWRWQDPLPKTSHILREWGVLT
jgi:Uma2 family endonuclease